MIHDLIKEIPDFPLDLENQLVHCILAHHGELEYGSPKKPAMVEAGDYIRFVPIDEDEYKRIRELVERGEYQCTVHEEA